jgi:hypothetical protein
MILRRWSGGMGKGFKGEALNREWAVLILPICHSFKVLPWMRTYTAGHLFVISDGCRQEAPEVMPAN